MKNILKTTKLALLVALAMTSTTYAMEVSSVEEAVAENEYSIKKPATFGFLKYAYEQKNYQILTLPLLLTR